MNISDEAVEAAARAVADQLAANELGWVDADDLADTVIDVRDFDMRAAIRSALEAAAPYMLAADERAEAWDEGRRSYRDDLAGTPSFGTPGYKETPNPYRSQP